MHRHLELPGQLVGLVLLLAAVAWTLGWRRSSDAQDRQVASLGWVLGVVALVLLTGVVRTVTWPTYGLCMATGCLVLAALTIRWSRQQRLLSMEHMVEALLITGVCGLIGARCVFLIESWDTHFTDRPPAMAVSILEPLAAGDTLVLSTHEQAPFAVAFEGDETSLTRLKQRLDAAGAEHDLVVRLRTTQHRGPAGIESSERGLLLGTRRRGVAAVLRVVGGAAAPKLGLAPRSYTTGVAVPLSRVFDLRMGGLTYFGSVIGVLLSAAVYLRLRRVSYLRMLDLVAPALPLGLFFGRLGCLANGCCWGREAGPDALFAVRYPPWTPAWSQFAAEKLPCRFDPELAKKVLTPDMSAALGPLASGTPPLLPTQLYEGLAVLVIFFLALAYRRWMQARVGQAFAVVVLLQAPVRFAVEHLRRDHEVFFHVAGYPFTESQSVAAVMFVLGAAGMIYLSRKGRPLDEEAQGAPLAPLAEAAPLAEVAPQAEAAPLASDGAAPSAPGAASPQVGG